MTATSHDRTLNPSIKEPQSRSEAYRAVWLSVSRSINEPSFHGRPLDEPFTEDMGFGMKRTPEQAAWLEEARLDMIIKVNAALIEIRDMLPQ